jgi:hypothetical protein
MPIVRRVSRIVYMLGSICLSPEVCEIVSGSSRPGARGMVMVMVTIIVEAKVEINSVMA